MKLYKGSQTPCTITVHDSNIPPVLADDVLSVHRLRCGVCGAVVETGFGSLYVFAGVVHCSNCQVDPESLGDWVYYLCGSIALIVWSAFIYELLIK